MTLPRQSECWEWPWLNADGYGEHRAGSAGAPLHGARIERIHRVVFEQAHGYAPELVHHKCKNRACFNPWHLEASTFATHPDACFNWQSAKTHCKRGHPYTGDNLLVIRRSNGRIQRDCRACRELRRERAKARR